MPPLIEVNHLSKYFKVPAGMLHAVDNVSFAIQKGETLGVVGESGCGKSTLGRTMIHLQEATAGQIFLDGEDITHVRGKKLGEIRRKVQIIFQDPYSSLNPRQRIEDTIREPLANSRMYSRSQLKEMTWDLMDRVGIDTRLRQSYPHELDGGRRQRVGIARALALKPEFIVCDEPVSSLDVSIQAQVLNLLMDLQEEMGVTYMFVTHDLSVVRHISTHICVMYLGEVVEMCPSKELFTHYLHPYTKALLSAIPSLDIDHPMQPIPLQGELTSPINPKPGCRFLPRCPFAAEACGQPQMLEEVSGQHFVACCRVREIN
jgi:oligopeptide/dipeptide ABC transporter ATP-binding protein